MKRCPASADLQRFLDEQFDDAQQLTVSQHIDNCSTCQTALEQLTQECVPVVKSGEQTQRLGRDAVPQSSNHQTWAVFLARLKNSKPIRTGRADTHPGFHAPSSGSGLDSLSTNLVVPGYEILGELGRGGMGVVYKARQVGLNRLVALKVMRSGASAQPRERERFSQEAEAVARLRHPHIVHIYDVGESAGMPYIALEYVEGGSLADRLRGDPQPLLPAVQLMETLARTIHHAHQHGVVHRDLKPGNVLLSGEKNESDTPTAQRAGFDTPKITDFGLAKRIDESSVRTGSGDVVGTPSYMAPEQADGKSQPIGPATDVYALGTILYELLTGRPPFKGATAVDTVILLLHQEPLRPSSLRPDIPRDLETICLTCLAKEPARRYASAEALADDLERFRRGKPISARPVGVLERAAKWGRRHPLSASLLAGMILVGLLGFAGVTWQWKKAEAAHDTVLEEKRQKEREREQAEHARAEAVEARRQEAEQRKQARVSLYYSRIAQSQLSWRVNDFHDARQVLQKGIPSAGLEDLRGWEWYYLRRLYQADLFTLTHQQPGGGGAVAYAPRGGILASVITSPLGQEGQDGELKAWDAATGKPVLVKSIAGTIQRLAFSPDGSRIALTGTDGLAVILAADTGRELLRWNAHQQDVAGVAYSRDGKRLATGSWDKTVKIWDGQTDVVLKTLTGHSDRIQDLAFDPSGEQLASASWDGTVRLWDVKTGKELKVLQGHTTPVFSVTFSPNGALLASSVRSGNVKIWELATGRVVQSVSGLAGAVLNLAFSPDGRYLGYGGGDATVRIWDVESGVERIIFRGHTAPVECVDFSPDGQRLVSCSPKDGTVIVWDLTRHPEYAVFARTSADVEAAAFDREGLQLMTLNVQGKLQTWDRATGILRDERSLPIHPQVVSPSVSAVFSAGGDLLAACSLEDNRVVQLWETASGRSLLRLKAHATPIGNLRFSPDGRYLATADLGDAKAKTKPEIRIWDARSGQPVQTLSPPGRVFNLTFLPDTDWLAWAGAGGFVQVIHWSSGRKASGLPTCRGEVSGLAVSADGNLLAAVGSEDRAVSLFRKVAGPTEDTFSWQPVRKVPAPRQLCGLAFSPDGKRLAGITRDAVKLWDAEADLEVMTLRGAPQRYWDAPFNPRVLFSPDGRGLVGTNWDESISLWEAESADSDTSPDSRGQQRRQSADARAVFWHLQEAEHCLQHGNRAAAEFHLKRLGSAPLPPVMQLRKNQLMKQS